MKFLILQAILSDKDKKIYQHLVNSFNLVVDDIEWFYFNLLFLFPDLDLTWLETMYKDDKDNVLGMIEDVYPMISSGFTSFEDYLRNAEGV